MAGISSSDSQKVGTTEKPASGRGRGILLSLVEDENCWYLLGRYTRDTGTTGFAPSRINIAWFRLLIQPVFVARVSRIRDSIESSKFKTRKVRRFPVERQGLGTSFFDA